MKYRVGDPEPRLRSVGPTISADSLAIGTWPGAGYAGTNSWQAARDAVRSFTSLEKRSAVVAFAQSIPGKIVLLLAFGLESFYFFRDLQVLLPLMAALAIITLLPQSRHFVISIAPLLITTVQNAGRIDLLAMHMGIVGTGMALYWCARLWPDSWYGRRPVLVLLCSFSALIVWGCALPEGTALHGNVWNLVGIAESYVWFIGYSLLDHRGKTGTDSPLQLATFHPVWGSASVPFPKGAAYLRRIEAQNAEQLAVVQLKALKLLLWAILLALLSDQWMHFFHETLRVPNVWQVVAMNTAGTPYAWHICWASVLLCFFEAVLTISVLGHRMIACCRMAGFNALRNTYRPLAATSVAEFYNRFYYYFKELLVDFFFYPTFQRFWKKNHRVRLIFANFVAVFLGNTFFHYVHYWWYIRNQGLVGSLISFQVFFFYSFALATVISISQARHRRPRPRGFLRGQLLPSVSVGFIFCLLFMFGSAQRDQTLVEYLRFFASLFFVHV